MENGSRRREEEELAKAIVAQQAQRKLNSLCEDGLCEDDDYVRSLRLMAAGGITTAADMEKQREEVQRYDFAEEGWWQRLKSFLNQL